MNTTTSTASPTTTTRTVRFLGKCKGCGAKHAVSKQEIKRVEEIRRHDHTGAELFPMRRYHYTLEGDRCTRTEATRFLTFRCACERNIALERVKGTFSEAHKCGARCLASTGPTCECSCGGKNHGANHAH